MNFELKINCGRPIERSRWAEGRRTLLPLLGGRLAHWVLGGRSAASPRQPEGPEAAGRGGLFLYRVNFGYPFYGSASNSSVT